jgi:adenylosuccinate lyase
MAKERKSYIVLDMEIPLTPLDGRYYDRVKALVPYLSENALISYRVKVEITWLKKIVIIAKSSIDDSVVKFLDTVEAEFSNEDAAEVRKIEAEINHDVKAVEIWLAKRLRDENFDDLAPYIHFARTSEDINNIAYALMVRDARDKVIVPSIESVTNRLKDLSQSEKNSVMLARTHGQSATPTTMGKEFAVYYNRTILQLNYIKNVNILAKFSGATGTYAADLIAFPNIDWQNEMKQFVESFGLEFNPVTTQIEPHDWLARLCNEMRLEATILIGLARDCWQYISAGYLAQTVKVDEVGSSTMPHKVNPIDFENAEANLGLACALLSHMSDKLPISRLQRDLSDSSVMRAISEAFGHYLLAVKSLEKGLLKVSGNTDAMSADIVNEWALLTEAIQTIMRKNGIADAYEQMKQISRGKQISEIEIKQFIDGLDIDDDDKNRLRELTPTSYIGLAPQLADI